MSAREPFQDIVEGIYRMVLAFREYHMEPAIIELSSWEDGQRLMSLLDREHRAYLELGMDDKTGEPRNQVTIMGVIVRWPAKRRVLRDGGFEYF